LPNNRNKIVQEWCNNLFYNRSTIF